MCLHHEEIEERAEDGSNEEACDDVSQVVHTEVYACEGCRERPEEEAEGNGPVAEEQ